MKALTFKEFLKGHYQTGECLSHDNILLVEMRNLGWYPFSSPYLKENKHYVSGQGVPKWFKEGSRIWDYDIRTCLEELGR